MKVILIMAMTADGKIARDSMELVDWTGKADKKYFVGVTRETGVMIMGSKTFDTIGRPLPGRKSVVLTRNKDRTSDHQDLVFTDRAPEEILEDLSSEGYTSAALIGGSVVNSLFMAKGLVDEYHVTLVPRLFGDGLPMFDTPFDARMELIEALPLETDSLLLKYKVFKTEIQGL